jgi:hypothetical protein
MNRNGIGKFTIIIIIKKRKGNKKKEKNKQTKVKMEPYSGTLASGRDADQGCGALPG